MDELTFDVVIVGAGAAGIAAARKLSREGLSVALLEARDRVGGRIDSIREESGQTPNELGAEFVHGKPREIWDCLRDASLEAVELSGQTWVFEDGKLRRSDDYFDRVDRVLERMEQDDGPDRSFAEFAAAVDWAPGGCEDLEAAAAYVRGFDAAAPDRISVKSLVREHRASAQIDGDRLFRVVCGFEAILKHLLDGFDSSRVHLALNTTVTDVRWSAGRVEVDAAVLSGLRRVTFRAPRGIVTLPAGVLKATPPAPGAIRFVPDPPAIRSALESIEMGHVVKIRLHFRERFWDELGLERLSFAFRRGAPFPTWWTDYPVVNTALTAWAGGPAAVALAGLSEGERVQAAVESLADMVGLPAARVESDLEGWYTHDWSADPLAAGAYSYLRPGGIDAPAVLATPVEDTLFFAGEATSAEGHYGTVHGAIASGYRVANRILGLVRGPVSVVRDDE